MGAQVLFKTKKEKRIPSVHVGCNSDADVKSSKRTYEVCKHNVLQTLSTNHVFLFGDLHVLGRNAKSLSNEADGPIVHTSDRILSRDMCCIQPICVVESSVHKAAPQQE